MPLEIKEQDGKIWSHIRKMWLVKTPEEIVRQSFLLTIVNQYEYEIDQMDEEREITGRGSAQARADFVIWKTKDDKKSQKPPFIIVECKADNVNINQDVYFQGEHYARMTDAPFFVTHNNNETKYWRVKKDKMPGYIDEISDIPKVSSSDKEIQEILDKLKVFKENEFADLLHQCHNIIRNREKLDPAAAFDEIAKILFMKVYAERNLKADMKGNIFTLDYIEQGEKFNPDYLSDIFEKTKREFGKDKIFKKDEKINLKINTIKEIISKLEKYNLSATSTDIKGIAFERFLGRTFRGEIGQFFTPRAIVNFMINMIKPKEGEVVCDPASGSGGFLIQFFELVREEINKSIDEEYKKQKTDIDKDKNLSEEQKAEKLTELFEKLRKELNPTIEGSRIWKLSNRYIYGIDANERMARTSKMNMIMHGDGHGGIHHHDGFLNVNGIFEERFDIILTNPPFGQTVDKGDEVQESQLDISEDTKEYYKKVYGDAYERSQEKIKVNIGKPLTSLFDLPKGNSIKTEILFIERCLSLLKPGGRLGIVLPEGVFNNPSLSYVREFAEDRAFINAIISLPQETFFSTGASVKASLLFMEKFSVEDKTKWDNLLIKHREEILKAQQEERGEIENILKDKKKNKDEKKEAKTRLTEIDNNLIIEARAKAKEEFNYPIFMCEAQKVGITATGEDDINELPQIAIAYHQFKNNSDEFMKNLESKEGNE